MTRERLSVKLAVRVPPTLWARIADVAMGTGLTPSEVVRSWIERCAAEDLDEGPTEPRQWLYLGHL